MTENRTEIVTGSAMQSREQIERERDGILALIQTELHGNDPCNEVNAKAWAMIDALDWVLQTECVGRPTEEIKQRIGIWQKDHARPT